MPAGHGDFMIISFIHTRLIGQIIKTFPMAVFSRLLWLVLSILELFGEKVGFSATLTSTLTLLLAQGMNLYIYVVWKITQLISIASYGWFVKRSTLNLTHTHFKGKRRQNLPQNVLHNNGHILFNCFKRLTYIKALYFRDIIHFRTFLSWTIILRGICIWALYYVAARQTWRHNMS